MRQPCSDQAILSRTRVSPFIAGVSAVLHPCDRRLQRRNFARQPLLEEKKWRKNLRFSKMAVSLHSQYRKGVR